MLVCITCSGNVSGDDGAAGRMAGDELFDGEGCVADLSVVESGAGCCEFFSCKKVYAIAATRMIAEPINPMRVRFHEDFGTLF